MYTFHQHVRRYQHLIVGVVEYSTIVAYTIFGRLVLWLYIFGQPVDESELTQFCYFHFSVGCSVL